MRTLLADFRYAFRVLVRAPVVRPRRRRRPRARHRRQHRHLQHRQRRAAAAAAVRASRIGSSGCSTCRRRTRSRACRRFSVSPANFYDWKRDARLFEGMAIYRFRQFTLTGGGERGSRSSPARSGADFFEVVRAQPALGRVFLAGGGRPRPVARRHPQRRVLEERISAARRRRRPHAHARRRGLHDRRRHAGAVLGRVLGRDRARPLGAARLHRRRRAPSARTTTRRSSRG